MLSDKEDGLPDEVLGYLMRDSVLSDEKNVLPDDLMRSAVLSVEQNVLPDEDAVLPDEGAVIPT